MVALELRPAVTVGAQVTVSPQVVARAALLELPQDGLEERIREELEGNPALELVDTPGAMRIGAARGESEPLGDLLEHYAAPVSLGDDLLWQARAVCRGRRLAQVEYLIESLDPRGFLTSALPAIAGELRARESDVLAALEVLQSLDPAGIGARDLPECLRLQVLRMGVDQAPPGLLGFIDGEFREVVQSGDPRALHSLAGRGTGVYMRFISECLYPYPADLFRPPHVSQETAVPARLPDAALERDGGCLRVTVPMSTRIALQVNSAYDRLARTVHESMSESDAEQVRRMVQGARSFITNLAHRHQVIAQVTAALIDEQREFLIYGPQALKPLTKKELAQRLNMHESTICRATRGKCVMLPDGEVLPFDVFFEDALPAKAALARLVRQEPPDAPYTDADLAHELTAQGHAVARRTVGKYRDALGIPPAAERRKQAIGGSPCSQPTRTAPGPPS